MSKFKPGDQAVYTGTYCDTLIDGETVETLRSWDVTDLRIWEVKSIKTGRFGWVSENYLALKPSFTDVLNSYTPNINHLITLPPGFNIDEERLKDAVYKGSGEMKISWDEPKTHSCSWKTYTGLMYKEEYCDCGQTRNRRGIYE